MIKVSFSRNVNGIKQNFVSMVSAIVHFKRPEYHKYINFIILNNYSNDINPALQVENLVIDGVPVE